MSQRPALFKPACHPCECGLAFVFDLRPRSKRARVTTQAAQSDLPPELAGLELSEGGDLVDTSTGKALDQFGSTRFDVAARALRGEFDPPAGTDNHERAASVLLDSLVKWPAPYEFQFVLRSGGAQPAAVLEEMRALVQRVCAVDVPVEQCTAKGRKGGKYVSVTVPALIRAPVYIQRVFDQLQNDDRVLMKY